MPPVSRVKDYAFAPICFHGKPCCPHVVTGPAKAGSPNVIVNNQQVLRVGDPGGHAKPCCGSNSWKCAAGSSTVFVNGKPVVRELDRTSHCGGIGYMVEGSPDVIVG